MRDKKKGGEKRKKPWIANVNIQPPTRVRNAHIFDAHAIHTGSGMGALVETRRIEDKEVFTVTHLGTGGCVPLTIDGARALKELLDQWIEKRDGWSLAV